MLRLFDSAATLRRGVREKFSLVFLFYLDLVLTIYAISRGLSELNPYMQILLTNPLLLLLVKAVAPLFIVWLVPAKLLRPSIAFMVFVTAWNARELILFLT